MKSPREKHFLSPSEMAALTGFSARHIQRMCAAKQIPHAEQTSGGHFRVRFSPIEQPEVKQWIERNRKGTLTLLAETGRPDLFVKAIGELPYKISEAFYHSVGRAKLSRKQRKQIALTAEALNNTLKRIYG